MQSAERSRLLAFLYNQNPFYLISAGVVLFGLSNPILAGSNGEIGPWILASIIAGYTGLLALTAFLIVRYGKVWDDARSIFMVLILLFLALSVSFDALCIANVSLATRMLALGFSFTVVVTELLLAGLGIRFDARFKLSFYLMLALSFFFPLAMPLKESLMPSLDSRWLLASFPVLIGLAILSLIPAVRCSAAGHGENGTPWTWPMFPWSVFVLLVVGLCGRGWLLTQAFDPTAGSGTIFTTWFLVPVLFSVLIVLVEISVVEKISSLRLLVFPGALALPLLGGSWLADPAQKQFEQMVTVTLASPIWLGLFLSGVVFAVAAMKKIEGGHRLLMAVTIAGLIIRPDGTMAGSFGQLQIWPALLLAVIPHFGNLFRSNSKRWTMSVGSVAIAAGIFVAGKYGDTAGVIVSLQVVIAGGLVVAFCFHDRWAIVLRIATAVFLPVLTLCVLVSTSLVNGLPAAVAPAYGAVLALLMLCVYVVSRDRLYLLSSTLTGALALVQLIATVPLTIESRYERLVSSIEIGVACFGIAVVVSCLKAGMAGSIRRQAGSVMGDIRLALENAQTPESEAASQPPSDVQSAKT